MATFVNGAVWGSFGGRARYAYLNGDVTRSGNTVTLSNLTLYFVMSGIAYGTGTETVSIRVGSCSGTSVSDTVVTWNMGSGSTTSNTVGLNNASVTVNPSDTSYTFYLTVPGGDCAQFTATFPAGGSAAQSGTFIITGLTPSTSYALKTRVQTTAGATNNTDLTFTTSATNPQARLYGSVSGDTTRVTPLYGSVNSQSAFIVKLYGPEQVTTLTYTVTDIANNTGFDSTTFMSKYNTEYGDLTKEPATLLVGEVPTGSGSMKAFLYDSNNTMIHLLFSWAKYSYNDEGLVWGFASEPASGAVTSTSTTQTGYQTKRIF